MTQTYEVSLLSPTSGDQFLGEMPASAITFNRYNKGLLVAAGKICKTHTKDSIFLKFSARFHDKAVLQFRCGDHAYTGDFCFINFDIETNIVVFGSVGPVQEIDFSEETVDVEPTHRAPAQTPELQHAI